jgi:putative oxidoreductase
MTDAVRIKRGSSVSRTVFVWVARLAVGLLFIYTGYTKVTEPDPLTFVKEVRTYTLMPPVLSNATALILPWVEIFAGLLLISGLWRREGRVLLAAMLIVFIGAKAAGFKGDCGCVPANSILKPLFEGWHGFATNAVLLILLVVEAYLERPRKPAPPVALPGPEQEPASA